MVLEVDKRVKEVVVFSKSEIVVIYDGECRFCNACLAWLEHKLTITAVAFQTGDLNSYGLTRAQCEVEVHAISGGEKYSGASAAAFLLHERGSVFLSAIVRGSGPLGRAAYRWVATHRNSTLVRLLTRWLERKSRK